MKKYFAALALAPAIGSAAISYEGTLNDGATQSGVLPVESGWAQASGAAVDFWSFEGNEGESISILAQSAMTDVAFSLFSGTPDSISQPLWFSNDSDWDLFEFVNLSSTPGDESLLNFILPSTSSFSVVIGGEVPDFLADQGAFSYTLQLAREAVDVPTPGAAWLMLSGFAGLFMARRRTA